MTSEAQVAEESTADLLHIQKSVQDYFDGLYEADVEKLRAIFHPDAVLKAPDLRRSLNEWLTLVATRKVPKTLGLPYRFKLLSIDLIGRQAMVKVECPLFEFFYIDFLGFLKEDGQWKIVNKMYAEA